MNIQQAKRALDNVINKGRVHMYKPIQVAEVLYRDRLQRNIDLASVDTYRIASKRWRDEVCQVLVGRVCTSSAKYQDDVFNTNAVPPEALAALGEENRAKSGIVEAYIYKRFQAKYEQLYEAVDYVGSATPDNFELASLVEYFRGAPGLRRSIDKIYEITVYALFSALVRHIGVTVEVGYDSDKIDLLREFEDFAKKVICIDSSRASCKGPARLYRVGVTNAADRGLDMWSSFGLAIQVKHISLSEEAACGIVEGITADRIVIVCRSSDVQPILAVLNQIGWRSRIQSIVTELDLIDWYERALRGKYADELANDLLRTFHEEMLAEFPSSEESNLRGLICDRGYDKLADTSWEV